jgi:hypothetical protein
MLTNETLPDAVGAQVERGVMPHRAGARGRGLSGHQSAKMKNDEWLTPPEILRALGPFDLDPCAPIARPWETAAAHYTAEDDGLSKPWAGRVWCNPPFGREAVKWFVEPDLLVLDEIGVQYGTETEQKILFRIIDLRYEEMKPTILISNLAIPAFTEFVGERVVDRMRENGGMLFAFDWESYRSKA